LKNPSEKRAGRAAQVEALSSNPSASKQNKTKPTTEPVIGKWELIQGGRGFQNLEEKIDIRTATSHTSQELTEAGYFRVC
jgi:hypothetical protein